jgi:PAS domain-containing protein
MNTAKALANTGSEADKQAHSVLHRPGVQLTTVFVATPIASGLFEIWQSHVATWHPVLLEILLNASTATLWVWIVLRREDRSRSKLEKAEKKYRGMFEDAIIGIFQESPQGCLLSVNRAFAKMYGYSGPKALTAEVPNIGQL